MNSTDTRADRWRGAAGGVALLAAFAIGFAQSYLRWLDPIIDAGRDLYISEQIAAGAKLYRDIRYVYPPLTPYLLSGWVAAFGASLSSFATFGILAGVAVAALLFEIVRRTVSTTAATAAVLLFVALNFFGASSWGCNFVFPYTYSATIGLLAYLAFGLCAIVVSSATEGRLTTVTAFGAIAAVAAAWSKLEFAFAVGIVAIVVLLFVPRLRALIALGAGLEVLSFAGVWAFFRGNPPGHHWLFDNVLVSSLLGGESSSRFYAEVFGSDAPAQHLTEIVLGSLFIVTFALCLRALDRSTLSRAQAFFLIAAIVLATIALANDNFFKAWAALQIALIPFAIRDRGRSPLLVLLALSFGTSLRIFLNLKPGWYGFVFAVPTYALIAFVLLEYLPARGVYTRKTALAWLPLVVLLAISGLAQQRERYEAKQFAIDTPRGRLLDANPDRAAIAGQALRFLAERKPTGLVVIPEGLSINYFSGIPTPLSFHMFIPPETADPRVEAKILAEMEAKQPAMIALNSRDVGEFGSRGFGVDYDVELNRYIRENYVAERGWVRPRFSLLLLRKRP